MIPPTRPPTTNDWALRLAPQDLAGTTAAGAAFAGLCMFALFLIFIGDVVAFPRGQLGVVALVPVTAAAWLLSQRMTYAIVLVAMLLDGAATIATSALPTLAVINVVMIGVMAMLGRLAATSVLRTREVLRSEREARSGLARAERLEREKSDFLRLASHELRGPVSILHGYIAMLEDGSLGELPGPAAAVVPILAATAVGMSDTVDQMLDTARIEDDRLHLRMARSDLARIVNDAARTVAVLHGATGRMRVSGAASPLMVDVDAPRVRTIVGNLVSNAVKYSSDTAEVTVTVRTAGKRALVEVADHGIGIPAAALPKLFTRFSRLHDTRTEGVPGTGLGLYLSRELARRHGGDITVVSKPGAGSTFTLSLPLPSPQPARSSASASPGYTSHSRSIAG